MTQKEMAQLFERLRDLVCLTESQRAFDARKWRECVSLWLGVFARDSYADVWAGVRMYIHNGGKFWPYPGEIADLMPASPWCDNAELRDLSYQTRAQARIEADRLEKQHRLNPWR